MSITITKPSKAKKIILLTRESELKYVQDYYSDEEHRKIAYKIVDALFNLEKSDIVTQNYIDLFITDMKLASWRATSKGAVTLCLLIHHKSVLDTIHALLKHPKWQMRFHIIAEFDRLSVNDTSSELLKIALQDRSYRNRIKAIETIFDNGYEDLYSFVEEMNFTEKNKGVISTIQYFKKMGY